MNFPPMNCYWELDSQLSNEEHAYDNKAKLCYQSAMCLLNPKQDPPITTNPTPCTIHNCECKLTEGGGILNPETMFSKPVLQSSIGIQTEDKKPPNPVREERPFKCLEPNCNKTFLLKHHLASHERTHTGERPHLCVHCGKSFTHKYCLNTHLLLHTKERPHQCTECNKKFTLKHHLISHMKVHSRDKPFVCQECGKSFSLKKQLITHGKFHRGERPFVCKECGDTFAQEIHLVMHLRFHGSLTSYVCTECGAAFTRKFELTDHERVHGKEPLMCPICSKEFLQKRTLVAHMKSHKHKMACRYCGEQFLLDKIADLHTVEHACKEVKGKETEPKSRPAAAKANKSKKFFCDICFRKFDAKHGLTQHKKRQHNIGSNLFSCQICNRGFREKFEFMKHKHNTA